MCNRIQQRVYTGWLERGNRTENRERYRVLKKIGKTATRKSDREIRLLLPPPPPCSPESVLMSKSCLSSKRQSLGYDTAPQVVDCDYAAPPDIRGGILYRQARTTVAPLYRNIRIKCVFHRPISTRGYRIRLISAYIYPYLDIYRSDQDIYTSQCRWSGYSFFDKEDTAASLR